MPTDEPDALALDEVGVMLVAGLQAREREIQREVMAPFARDVERVYRVIERLLELPDGAIGTTHHLIAGDPPHLHRVAPTAPGPA